MHTAKINGWDWIELTEMLLGPLSPQDRDDEDYYEALLEATRERLQEIKWDCLEVTEENAEICKWIRHFLRALAKKDAGYMGPFFLGIANISDEFTMLDIVQHNLCRLWV